MDNKIDQHISTPARSLSLSKRELEVFRWIAAGKSDWEISQILGISAKTVNYHVENVKKNMMSELVFRQLLQLCAMVCWSIDVATVKAFGQGAWFCNRHKPAHGAHHGRVTSKETTQGVIHDREHHRRFRLMAR